MRFRSFMAQSFVSIVVAAGSAIAQVPSTDIFLLPVDGATVGEPRRVTDRETHEISRQFTR